MRTSNPALRAFDQPQTLAAPAAATMTFAGALAKTGILLGLCFITAATSWQYMQGAPSGTGQIALIGSALGGLLVALIICFVPRTAPFLAPVYALLEGAVVGLISWYVPLRYGVDPGIVVPAMMLTFGIAGALLLTYSLGLVRLGSTATKVILVATAGVFVYYMFTFLANLIFNAGIPNLGWAGGWAGIGFSLFVVVLASLNLVLDFQAIEAGVRNRAPKHMEWYGAFALLVTLVWLYIEVLRLLAKFQKR